jgi:hypothetical protein
VVPEPVVTAPGAPAISETDRLAAREALRKRMEALETATPTAPPTTPVTRAPETSKPVVTAPADIPPADTTAPAVPQTPISRDALRRKVGEIESAEPVEPARGIGAKANPTAPVQPPLPTVESRFPKSKAQRLAELLERYRRDEVTPAQYHAERAKILAEPAPTAGN